MEKIVRTITTNFEIRASGNGNESRSIGGNAALVNTPTILWESEWDGKKEIYKEVILPGAFDNVLNDDVRALFNHNVDKILGRTTAGTLKIYLTPEGHLGYDIPDVPETTYGNDLLVSIRRKEINQSSFGFYVDEDRRQVEETSDTITYTREIVSFKQLDDVSPVTFPAYQQTITEMRNNAESIVKEMRSMGKTKTPKIDPNDDLAKFKSEQSTLALKIAIHKNA